MGNNRPVSLNSLSFTNSEGTIIVREDYFLQFENEEYAEVFIQSRYKFWKDLDDMKLSINIDMNETLAEIQIKSVLRLVSKYLGFRYRDVISKSQKRYFVEARRFAAIF